MRHSAPDSRNPAHAFDERMQDLSDLLSAGLRQGELRVVAPSLLGLLTRCVIDVLWLPENLIQDLGPETALAMARDDVIRGIVNRG